MGPSLLIDKSVVEGMLEGEVDTLGDYYTLLLAPILIRELHATLGKNADPRRDWHRRLASLARKVDTMNSYVPTDARSLVVSDLRGHEVPLDGPIPVPGGKHLRTRDGSYTMYLEEQPEKAMLRKWGKQDFDEETIAQGKAIRVAHTVNLAELKSGISRNADYMPAFKSMQEAVVWLDERYFDSVSQEHQLRVLLEDVVPRSFHADVLQRWRMQKSPLLSKFAPYAFSYYRTVTFFVVGLAKGIISTSKAAKAHLDIEYLLHLPLCRCFASSDNVQLEMARALSAHGQMVVHGDVLKRDISRIKEILATDEGMREKHQRFGSAPPYFEGSVTSELWKKSFPNIKKDYPKRKNSPEQKMTSKTARELIRMLEDAVDENDCSIKPRASKYSSMGLIERQKEFFNGVYDIVTEIAGDDWSAVRKKFGYEEVKRIYDLHASIWHPGDDFKGLAADFVSKTSHRRKFLYLGEINPTDVTKNILAWALQFDLILVVDPFFSPWVMREEHNPLANPSSYETDTLKLVHLMRLVAPLVDEGKLVFVPDITNFRNGLKADFFKIAKAPEGEWPEELARFKEEQLHAHLRVLARIPEMYQPKQIEALMGEAGLKPGLQLLRYMRRHDPICIDRDYPEKAAEVVIARCGVMFEIAILLAKMYEAIPFARDPRVCQRFVEIATRDLGVGDFFEDLPTLKIERPELIAALVQLGCFKSLNALFDRMVLLGEVSGDELRAVMEDYHLEFVDLLDVVAEFEQAKSQEVGLPGGLVVWASEGGFSSPEGDCIFEGKFSEMIHGWPKFFFELKA